MIVLISSFLIIFLKRKFLLFAYYCLFFPLNGLSILLIDGDRWIRFSNWCWLLQLFFNLNMGQRKPNCTLHTWAGWWLQQQWLPLLHMELNIWRTDLSWQQENSDSRSLELTLLTMAVLTFEKTATPSNEGIYTLQIYRIRRITIPCKKIRKLVADVDPN